MAEISTVQYFRKGSMITVERLHRAADVRTWHAQTFAELLGRAYGQQFETSKGMPAGTFERYFGADDRVRVGRRRRQMQHDIDQRGSQYWFIRRPSASEAPFVVGLAKVTPSRASFLQKLGMSGPNLFFNDLAVHPEQQRNGYAAMLAKTALQFSGVYTHKDVATHLFKNNPRFNAVVEGYGLSRVRTIEPLQIDLHHTLEQALYTTQGLNSVQHVLQALHRSHPWLITSEAQAA